MDLTTILGMVLAITSISVGDILEGGNPLHIIHLSSVLIVLPTAFFSAMTSTNKHFVKGAIKELKIVFKGSGVHMPHRIAQIVEFAMIARKDGLLALESKVAEIDNEYFKGALMMLVDGKEIEEIKESMELQIELSEEYYQECSEFFIRVGESCPTFGLVGAVCGLMLALQLLDDPQAMAQGIAGAFTATVTGIFGAYACFGPWGNKIKGNSHDIVLEQKMILEGVVGIAQGANPRDLEAKLFLFLPKGEKVKSQFGE
ncbi:flagellar motor stator protein MotA [Campylobacter canadensis]|uniref:Flagellar motor stator protein MotA n=1 Tax=Campylobacter canadensis TaxID=449520 RepID=A0ABS7WRA1_9BACT|nr:flagellar motor stator protein MotA [Campylobacter canadensis]MBZ7987287.1 flagellar motor stator protein MotA [Campylobacter canadensis]MBZ7994365.1 flagellar motor stator protein MotA [Campylobacter canadensis]MBZ7996062.1 flagellar motor stator protein MotA [Campylobacter canadensis]MBZ7998284.1 flagellar motor stator protein MotA [Campylobacter canadensis]MBZ7999698.1 flagellar motor stator protein MotA [Campylobacter canadensis]